MKILQKNYLVTYTDENFLKINTLNEEKYEIVNLFKYNLNKTYIEFIEIINDSFIVLVSKEKLMFILKIEVIII
jgi:hypothetical protein